MKRPTLDEPTGRELPIPPEFTERFITTDQLAEIILAETCRLIHQVDFQAAKKDRTGPRYFRLGNRVVFFRDEALSYFRAYYPNKSKAA